MFKVKLSRSFFLLHSFWLTNNWTTLQIVKVAFLIGLWPVLSVFAFGFRVLATEGQIPIFYFLIWLAGLVTKPYHAFVCGFFGHLLFDFTFFFNPLFFFVWIASALSATLISFFKTKWKWLFGVAIIIPFLYIFGFVVISLIMFSNANFLTYFLVFPKITFFLIIINPIFNFFVYFSFFYNKSLQKVVFLIQNK